MVLARAFGWDSNNQKHWGETMKRFLSACLFGLAILGVMRPRNADAQSGQNTEFTGNFTTEERHALLTSLELSNRARRQWAGAVSTYVISIPGLVYGLGATFGTPCYEQGASWGYERRFRCRNEDGVIDLDFEARRGVKVTIASLAFGLGAGLPLHRSANYHRRAARLLLHNAGEATHWDLASHRGQNQQRVGRSFLIASGVSAAMSTSFLISMATTDHERRTDKRGSAALISGVGALSAATIGSALFIHGRKTNADSRTHSAQILVTPTFYADGMGAQLFLGF